MGMIGLYGLLMAFVATCQELAQAWGSFSVWCSNLAQGVLIALPPTIWSTWMNAELTCILSSIVPLILIAVGVYVCRETLRPEP
jgi:hypothetical protein